MRTKEHDGLTKIFRQEPNEFSITIPGFETITWEKEEITQKLVQDFIDRIPTHNKCPVMIMSIGLYRHINEKFSAFFISANKGTPEIYATSYYVGQQKKIAFGFIKKPQAKFLLVLMY